jgi:hypothetical protein
MLGDTRKPASHNDASPLLAAVARRLRAALGGKNKGFSPSSPRPACAPYRPVTAPGSAQPRCSSFRIGGARQQRGNSAVIRSLSSQHQRGPPGVYELVISGHQESPWVRGIRRNQAPEVTGDDSARQAPITRNEGVPGSSPGVGFSDLQGFRAPSKGLSEGFRGPPEVYY